MASACQSHLQPCGMRSIDNARILPKRSTSLQGNAVSFPRDCVFSTLNRSIVLPKRSLSCRRTNVSAVAIAPTGSRIAAVKEDATQVLNTMVEEMRSLNESMRNSSGRKKGSQPWALKDLHQRLGVLMDRADLLQADMEKFSRKGKGSRISLHMQVSLKAVEQEFQSLKNIIQLSEVNVKPLCTSRNNSSSHGRDASASPAPKKSFLAFRLPHVKEMSAVFGMARKLTKLASHCSCELHRVSQRWDLADRLATHYATTQLIRQTLSSHSRSTLSSRGSSSPLSPRNLPGSSSPSRLRATSPSRSKSVTTSIRCTAVMTGMAESAAPVAEVAPLRAGYQASALEYSSDPGSRKAKSEIERRVQAKLSQFRSTKMTETAIPVSSPSAAGAATGTATGTGIGTGVLALLTKNLRQALLGGTGPSLGPRWGQDLEQGRGWALGAMRRGSPRGGRGRRGPAGSRPAPLRESQAPVLGATEGTGVTAAGSGLDGILTAVDKIKGDLGQVQSAIKGESPSTETVVASIRRHRDSARPQRVQSLPPSDPAYVQQLEQRVRAAEDSARQSQALLSRLHSGLSNLRRTLRAGNIRRALAEVGSLLHSAASSLSSPSNGSVRSWWTVGTPGKEGEWATFPPPEDPPKEAETAPEIDGTGQTDGVSGHTLVPADVGPATVANESGPRVTLHYVTSWPQSFLHFSVSSEEWTEVPGVAMDAAIIDGSHEVKVITVEADALEFVLTDGEGNWDKAPGGGNYKVSKSGTYLLMDGVVVDVDESK